MFTNISASAGRIARPPTESDKHHAHASNVAVNTARLLGNTVGGVISLASNVTGTLASGVNRLVLDESHQRTRDKQQRKEAKNVVEGFGKGALSIGHGVFSAVSGLVTQPVKGGQKSGAAGAAKGFFSAIVNLPTKVVSGTLDGVTNIVQGVANNISHEDRHRAPTAAISLAACPLVVVLPRKEL
jgi:hypothetical protein